MKDFFSRESVILMIITAILPLAIVKSSLIVTIIYFLVLVFMLLLEKKKEFCFLIFILCFCVPSQLSDEVNTSFFRIPTYLMSIFPVICAIPSIRKAYKNSYLRKPLMLFVVYGLLSASWFIIKGSFAEFNTLRRFALLLAMMILFYSSKITQKDFFCVLDSVSFVVAVYYVLEFFIRWNPYGEFFTYDLSLVQSVDISVVFRPHGLLGNPLVTGFLFLFELCSLVYRYFLSQKLNVVFFSFFSFVCILTISKSYILGLLFIIVLMLVFNSRISRKTNTKSLILLALGGIAIFQFSDVALGYFQHRMDNVGDSSSFLFRFYNFNMVWRLFCDYPLGVGICDLPILLETKYAHQDWILGLTTLDNVFLGYIGEYGIFAFFPLLLLFFWVFRASALRNQYYVHYLGVLAIALILLFMCFIFNWDRYYMPMSLLGAFLGSTMLSFKNTKV